MREMGVYLIVHAPTGRQYIGQTVNYTGRVSQHRSLLARRRHCNIKLQEDYDATGLDAFGFFLMEEVADFDTLLAAEKEWIDALHPFYNVYEPRRRRRPPAPPRPAGIRRPPHTPIMGVYALIDATTGLAYVGSSTDVTVRMRQHRNELRRGASRHSRLQKAWESAGEDAFAFIILETVADAGRLLAVEQEWLDCMPAELNRARSTTDPLRSFTWTDEEHEKQRRGRQRYRESEAGQEALQRLIAAAQTPEARQRSADASRTRWQGEGAHDLRQRMARSVRRHYESEEARRRSSEAHKKSPSV